MILLMEFIHFMHIIQNTRQSPTVIMMSVSVIHQELSLPYFDLQFDIVENNEFRKHLKHW